MKVALEGRVAIVTGGSKGIGQAIARGLVAAGARVMVTSRRHANLEAAAESIGGEVATFVANAGDPDAGARCVAATVDRFGGLDILVNNAATNPYFGPTLGVERSQLDKTLAVNLSGPLLWAQAAHPAFPSMGGVIINIASVGGLRPEPGLGIYNLTKAAVIHLTRQLAGELGPTRVVGIAPGLIRTDFSAALVESFGEQLARRLPSGRLGEPDDVASLAVFLASDHAAWITGETFVVDGGAGVSGA